MLRGPVGRVQSIEPATLELPGEQARLVVVQLDGTEAGVIPLAQGDNLLGRESGGILAEDSLLSGRHATLTLTGAKVVVRDEGSRNGVYVRLQRNQPVELVPSDCFCFGRNILRFDPLPPDGSLPAEQYIGLLALVVGLDVGKDLFPVPVPHAGLIIGRSRADLRFPQDNLTSGRHCQVAASGDRATLMDLGSSNGTFHRIRGHRALRDGDVLLLGQRIFHLHVP